jgi:hypothetical protein
LQLIATCRTVNAAALAVDELTEVVVELDVEANQHPARVTIGTEAWAAFRHAGLAQGTSVSPYRNGRRKHVSRATPRLLVLLVHSGRLTFN